MHEATEVHHWVPRRLLAAHDRMLAHVRLDGEALQLWFEYEGLLLEFGLDPDLSREELEGAIEASAAEVTCEEHRSKIHAPVWPRWGRKGGLPTLERYGRDWFVQLAHHRERLPWMRERMEENVMWTVRPPRLPKKTSYTSCSVPLEHSGRSV